MYKNFELKLKSGQLLKGCKWEISSPKAQLVIVTGMAESSYRYDEFASFLNKNGFSVFCIDHYGQGLNCIRPNQLGIWPQDGFSKAVEFVYEEVQLVRSYNKDIPLYIFGHSMGSFVTQEFIQLHGNSVNKAVICGSNGPNPAVGFGKFLAELRAKGKNHDNRRDATLDKLMFGSYLKKIKNPKTSFDWLSTNDESNKKYIDDFRCGYICTSGFYAEFMKGLDRIHKINNMQRVPASLPILLIAGKDDPVGNYGKGVAKLADIYKKIGIKKVDLRLYEGMRHEILNEVDRKTVYNDILKFLK
ncbi:MAG: alpha/beta fold hydrolase [Bacilli bacterium]|nr:alpha/beta fold hydrolase [Bacilli bacterium]